MQNESKVKDLGNGKFRKKSVKPTTFGYQLSDEQKAAKRVALDNTITFLTGKPGTSKTFLAAQIGLDGVISKEYGKLIVTRPMVDVGNSMGFLPGEAFSFTEGKTAPYLQPVLQQMYKLRSKEEITAMITKGTIEVVPVQFVRGLNFEDCIVIVDEAANLTHEEAKAIITRVGKDSKLIFTSDYNQIDLKNKNISLSNLVDKISELDGVGVYNLTENYRHPLAIEIMELIQSEDDKAKARRKEQEK